MKPHFRAFLAALVAVASHAHAQAQPSPPTAADVILTMNAYGPIQIGTPVAEVRRQLVQMGRKDLPSLAKVAKKGCSYFYASQELQFMVNDGKIVRIETTEKNVVTPSGIRVGSSLEKVRHALGSRLEEMQQHYAEDARMRTLILQSGDGKYAIRVDGGPSVDELFAGASHAIRYVEGCA